LLIHTCSLHPNSGFDTLYHQVPALATLLLLCSQPNVNSKGGRPPRRPLTAAEITDAAVALADEGGLESVSIRRLAAALDSRPMSLYRHFEGKSEILGSMVDRVVEEVVLPELPTEWREALKAIAERQYAMFIRHPWIVQVFGIQPRFGPNATRLAEQVAQATAKLAGPETERWTLQGTLNDYVLGHSLRAVSAPSGADLEEAIPAEDLARSPELSSLSDSLRTRASVERFEAGLEIVLDGIERRLESST
jgi:AcrR family transcriptional regulator